jgi:hypothetical protein
MACFINGPLLFYVEDAAFLFLQAGTFSKKLFTLLPE